MVDLDWGRYLPIGSGLLLVALGIWLLYLGSRSRALHVFAYLVIVAGLMEAVPRIIAFGFVAGPPGLPDTMTVYLAMPIPLLILYFAAVYPRPRTWLGASRWGPWAVVGLILTIEVLYLVNHWFYEGPDAPYRRWHWAAGPLYVLRVLEIPAYGVVCWLLARDYLRTAAGPHRTAILLVSLAFGVYAAYVATRTAWYGVLGIEGPTFLGGRLYREMGASLTVFPVAWAAALLLRHRFATEDEEARREIRRALLVLGGAALLATLVAFVYKVWPDVILPARGLFHTIVRTASVVLILVGIARYQLFDVQLRLRWTLSVGTTVTVLVSGLVAVSATAQWLLSEEGARLVEFLALVALVLLVSRARRFGDRVAEAALPGLGRPDGALGARQLEAYRTTLDKALAADGTLPPGADPMLTTLRTQLGITDRDHAVLLHALRASRGLADGAGDGLVPGVRILGRYEVVRLLGEGAHGRTVLARDEVLHREVAVKAIRADAADPDAVLREARAIGAIRDPHVVTIHDVERVGDRPYIIMEYLPGGSLRDRLEARGPLPPEELRAVARDLLGALHAVHEAKTVHRDVKPSNVLFTREGRAKLADFGIAHLPGSETTVGRLAEGGAAKGTVRYMSPEQARGRRVTLRGDLFSAAATLYEAYTGRPYLEAAPGESLVELQMRAASAGAFERPLNGAGPGPRAWFVRALDPVPERRFASARETLEAFEAAWGPPGLTLGRNTGASVPRPRRRPAAARVRPPGAGASN